jgi:hypothetical protein
MDKIEIETKEKEDILDILIKNEKAMDLYKQLVSDIYFQWHSHRADKQNNFACSYLFKKRNISKELVDKMNEVAVVGQLDKKALETRKQWILQQVKKLKLNKKNKVLLKKGFEFIADLAHNLSTNCTGWLCFLFCDGDGNPICIKFREGYSKEIRTLSLYPTGKLGIFPYHYTRERLSTLGNNARVFFCEGEFNSLAIYSAMHNLNQFDFAIVSIGSSQNCDFTAISKLYAGRTPIFIPDNDEASQGVIEACYENDWGVIVPEQFNLFKMEKNDALSDAATGL